MANNLKLEPQSGSQSPPDDDLNFKILFLPILVILMAIGLFKLFSGTPLTISGRGPASIPEIEPITVPVVLKTILKVTAADFDKSATARIRRDLLSGVLPSLLEKSSPVIIEKIKNGEMKFYSLKVSENFDDNGDEVEILVDGQSFASLVLSSSEKTITIPIEFGKTKMITVKALRDNGDGITFGAHLINSSFLLNNIQVGESDSVYLGFR